MCLGALYWARPARVFFAATQQDAAAAGFDDSFIYRELQLPAGERAIPTIHVADEMAERPFDGGRRKPTKRGIDHGSGVTERRMRMRTARNPTLWP